MRALAAFIISASAIFAQSAAPDHAAVRFKPIEFLFGNWIAQGGGASAGQGSGGFSFEPQINKQIVIRKNFAEYTAGPEAGTRHDDLMIIFNENDSLHAIYFDSEGHVIRYAVKAPSPDVAVFESDATKPGPKYRLTYSLRGAELNGKFEVNDKIYLNWSSVRKK